MEKITAVLVDDMPDALEILKLDLAEQCPEVEIIGTAGSVVDAAKLMRKETPDILFLDIMLGNDTGFDLLEILGTLSTQLIFVTAHDEYAIRAFRFSAVDYLLKPIDPILLRDAVGKAKLRISQSGESLDLLKVQLQNPEQIPQRISLPTQERIHVIDIENIIRCESLDNNTRFFLKDGTQIFVTKTLKKFEILLKDHPFMRVHQSHLVNLQELAAYEKREGGYIKMKNGDIVPVSVRKKAEVVKKLEALK